MTSLDLGLVTPDLVLGGASSAGNQTPHLGLDIDRAVESGLRSFRPPWAPAVSTTR
jgi:hypothetical protein